MRDCREHARKSGLNLLERGVQGGKESSLVAVFSLVPQDYANFRSLMRVLPKTVGIWLPAIVMNRIEAVEQTVR